MTAENKQHVSEAAQTEAAPPPPATERDTGMAEAETVEVVPCEMAGPGYRAEAEGMEQQEEPTAQGTLASPPVVAGPLEKSFRALAVIGPVSLLLLVLAHVWPEFWQARQGAGLYCPGELDVIKICQQTQASGDWLTPTAGALIAWPVFSAWLGLWTAFLPNDLGILLPLAGISAGLLALWAVWAFACAAGFGRQAALASGLVLLASPAFVPLFHQISPAGLAAALLMLSLLCLCKGWQAPFSWLFLPLGFVLAGLAGLTGGIFHLLVPLLTSLLFLFWRCTFKRAQAADALTGFLLLLVMLGGWLGIVILFGNAQGYLPALGDLLFQWRGLDLAAWFAPLLVAGLALLPWLLLLFFVSWGRVLSSSIRDLNASRHERAGAAFSWLAAFSGLLLLFLVPQGQLPTAGTALACIAAPLLGKALLRLSPLGSRFLYLVVALLFLHAGMAIAAAGFETSLNWMDSLFSMGLTAENRAFLLGLEGLPLIGGGCILLAILLTRFTRRSAPAGALLACVLGIALLAQPAMLSLLPSLAAQPKARLSTLPTAAPAVQTAPAATPAVQPEPVPVPESAPAPEAVAPKTAAPEALVPESPASTAPQQPEGLAAPEAAPEAVASPATSDAAAPAPSEPAPEATASQPAQQAQDGQAPAATPASESVGHDTPAVAPTETPAEAPTEVPAETPAEAAPVPQQPGGEAQPEQPVAPAASPQPTAS